jgi:hypothetical protein
MPVPRKRSVFALDEMDKDFELADEIGWSGFTIESIMELMCTKAKWYYRYHPARHKYSFAEGLNLGFTAPPTALQPQMAQSIMSKI